MRANMIYNIYSKNGFLVSIEEGQQAPVGFTHDAQTTDPDYIENIYKGAIAWCDSMLLKIDSQSERSKRELLIATALGIPNDEALERLINIETQAEYYREVRYENSLKLQSIR